MVALKHPASLPLFASCMQRAKGGAKHNLDPFGGEHRLYQLRRQSVGLVILIVLVSLAVGAQSSSAPMTSGVAPSGLVANSIRQTSHFFNNGTTIGTPHRQQPYKHSRTSALTCGGSRIGEGSQRARENAPAGDGRKRAHPWADNSAYHRKSITEAGRLEAVEQPVDEVAGQQGDHDGKQYAAHPV